MIKNDGILYKRVKDCKRLGCQGWHMSDPSDEDGPDIWDCMEDEHSVSELEFEEKIEHGLKILSRAYSLNLTKNNMFDHNVMNKIKKKYPEIAYRVEIDWWGKNMGKVNTISRLVMSRFKSLLWVFDLTKEYPLQERICDRCYAYTHTEYRVNEELCTPCIVQKYVMIQDKSV